MKETALSDISDRMDKVFELIPIRAMVRFPGDTKPVSLVCLEDTRVCTMARASVNMNLKYEMK